MALDPAHLSHGLALDTLAALIHLDAQGDPAAVSSLLRLLNEVPAPFFSVILPGVITIAHAPTEAPQDAPDTSTG